MEVECPPCHVALPGNGDDGGGGTGGSSSPRGRGAVGGLGASGSTSGGALYSGSASNTFACVCVCSHTSLPTVSQPTCVSTSLYVALSISCRCTHAHTHRCIVAAAPVSSLECVLARDPSSVSHHECLVSKCDTTTSPSLHSHSKKDAAKRRRTARQSLRGRTHTHRDTHSTGTTHTNRPTHTGLT